MPDPTNCLGCVCYNRGYAFVALCRELRAQHLCQKQIELRLAGQVIAEFETIEGESVRVEDEQRT